MNGYFWQNSTSEGNNAWGGYSMVERAGAASYKNVTRITKLRIAANGVTCDVSSAEVIKMIFHADRHIEQAAVSDQSRVRAMLRRGARGTGPVVVNQPALDALRRINDLH